MASNTDIITLLANPAFKKMVDGGILRAAREVLTEPTSTLGYFGRREFAKVAIHGQAFENFKNWIVSHDVIQAKADDITKITDEDIDLAIEESWNAAASVELPGQDAAAEAQAVVDSERAQKNALVAQVATLETQKSALRTERDTIAAERDAAVAAKEALEAAKAEDDAIVG